MSDSKKSYYAVIPASVRYDKDITPNSKLLYGEITALSNEKGFCWASNSYFAELYKVDQKSISRWIAELRQKNYISVELIYKEGTREIVHRYLRICPDPMDKNVPTPMDKNVEDNNTVINNTSNTTNEGKKRTKFTPPTWEQIAEYCNTNNYPIDIDRFIDHYNSNGWKIGHNKMSDWQATVRNWHRRDNETPQKKGAARPAFDYEKQREENEILFGGK
jgi:hypothetical protein